MLICRLILEEYGPEIEYIQGSKNILSDELSRLSINRKKYITHESTYKKYIESEINNTEEVPESFSC